MRWSGPDRLSGPRLTQPGVMPERGRSYSQGIKQTRMKRPDTPGFLNSSLGVCIGLLSCRFASRPVAKLLLEATVRGLLWEGGVTDTRLYNQRNQNCHLLHASSQVCLIFECTLLPVTLKQAGLAIRNKSLDYRVLGSLWRSFIVYHRIIAWLPRASTILSRVFVSSCLTASLSLEL